VEEVKTLGLLGYATERVPAEYAPALVIVGLALALLFVFVLPGPRGLATFELRIASRVRRAAPRELFRALVGHGREGTMSAFVTALLATFALTPYLVTPEVDGVALVAASSAMLVWSRMATTHGAVRSLDALLRATAVVVAMAVGLTVAVLHTGALELGELVRGQGGAPWQWNATRHPACAVAALVYLTGLVQLLRSRGPGQSSGQSGGLLERGGLLVASAVGATAFFGGWQVAPPGSEARGHLWLLAGAALLLAKTWALAGACLAVSRASSSIDGRELLRTLVRRLAPGLVLATALLVATRRIVPSALVETAFGVTVVALAVLFVLRLTARVHAAAARPEPHASPIL
jgi:hypothetical protein